MEERKRKVERKGSEGEEKEGREKGKVEKRNGMKCRRHRMEGGREMIGRK